MVIGFCDLFDNSAMVETNQPGGGEKKQKGKYFRTIFNSYKIFNFISLSCSLTPFLHLLLAADNKLRLSEFGLSRWAGTLSCRLPPSVRHTLNSRWVPPETLKELIFSKHSDVW